MAQKNHSYFGPTIYPSFVVNYDINYFPFKRGPTQLIISNSYEHYRGSPELPNQNLRQIGPGLPELWSDKQTDRQTDRQIDNQIYRDIKICIHRKSFRESNFQICCQYDMQRPQR